MKKLFYFDNAATSFPKAPGVADAMKEVIETYGGNSARASHKISLYLSELVFETRENLTEIISGENSSKMIFQKNGTEAINTAIFGIIQNKKNILVSPIEHNAVMRPLRELEKRNQITINMFKLNKDLTPALDDYEQQLKNGIDLVVCSACSNVSGLIMPYKELSETANKYDANFILDAAQLVGSYPFNIKDTKVDIICFPGHKGLLGPHGTGALYINSDIKINPLIFGGTGSKSESEYQPEFLPDKFEGGTLNLCGIAGLNEAIKFLKKTGIEKIQKREEELRQYFLNKLKELNSLNLIGHNSVNSYTSVISIISSKKSVSEIAAFLDEKNIAIRMGLHCAPAAHKTFGSFPTGSIRFSLGFFNTESEIDVVINLLKEFDL